MASFHTERTLYTLWLLSCKNYTKKELNAEYIKAGIGNASSYSIASYIKTLSNSGFKITTKKLGRTNVYHLNQKQCKLCLNEEEVNSLENLKRIIISQKNYKDIGKLMRVFYKFILETEKSDYRNILIDFDYYSRINWRLVKQLEEHCASKDIIIIDYAHPVKHSMKIQIHAESISINEWSNKIYLWGEVFNNGELSFLPVDRIFMVEKVVEKNIPFKSSLNEIEYKISRRLYNEIELDNEEKVKEITKEYVIIKRKNDNKFYIVQRLMSFCPELYYISNDSIKNEVEKRLKLVRKMYE